MKQSDKRIRAYLRQLRRFLLVSYPVRKKLMEGIRGELRDYLEDHPDVEFQQLLQEYGKPRDTAQALLEAAGISENAAGRRKRRIALCIAALLAAALTAFLIIWNIVLRQETECEVVETIVIYDVRDSPDASRPQEEATS